MSIDFFTKLLLSLTFIVYFIMLYNLFLVPKKIGKLEWMINFILYICIFSFKFNNTLIINIKIELVFLLWVLFRLFEGRKLGKAFVFVYSIIVTYVLEVLYQVAYSSLTLNDYKYLLEVRTDYNQHIILFQFVIVMLFSILHFKIRRKNRFILTYCYATN